MGGNRARSRQVANRCDVMAGRRSCSLPTEASCSASTLEAVVLPDDADGPKNVNKLDQQKWCLLEWACDPKS
eukprot:10599028-Heterocapsa_arctica.AAC.1